MRMTLAGCSIDSMSPDSSDESLGTAAELNSAGLSPVTTTGRTTARSMAPDCWFWSGDGTPSRLGVREPAQILEGEFGGPLAFALLAAVNMAP